MVINLRCVTHEETRDNEEVHGRKCGPHMNDRMLAKKVKKRDTTGPLLRLIDMHT